VENRPQPTNGVTITLLDANGNVVQVLENQPLSGQFIWPGASVNPPDWPGWILNEDGIWEEDPTDEILREGLTIDAFFNPSVVGFVEYPPATAACASPENPPTTTTTVVPTPQLLPPTR
jgi:hypothetical protein